MKMLLIYPPQWNPTSVYLSVPLLASQLRANGYHVDCLDLNVKFYNAILRSEHLLETVDESLIKFKKLEDIVNAKYGDAEEKFNDYPTDVQTLLLKYDCMRKMFEKGTDRLKETAAAIDSAVAVLRSKTDFYVPEKLFGAKRVIGDALKIASLPFAPNEIIFDNYFSNPLLKLDWINIDSQCKDREINMFIDFFISYSDKISEKNYDFIGISVPDLSQLIPAFTLARILKEKTSAKVCIGGNYITQNKSDFMNHPEIFDDYVDFLSVGDGETAIIEIARYIKGEIALSDVPNVICKTDNGNLKFTFEAEKLSFEKVSYPDFSQYDFSEYFSPEPVIPIQLSKGCYWGKCSFCDYYYGQQCFDIKCISRVIDEFKYYKNNYGITKFSFVDEAVPPRFYSQLADAIIENGIEITYYSFARLENGFTADVMKKLYRSGARLFLWGYETYSKRVLSMMNKGIDADKREEILTSAHNAGIWNNCLFIIGYPTETLDEIGMTLDFVRNNREIINSCTPSNFSLKKNAILHNYTEKDGIVSCTENGEFYTVCKDEIIGVPQHIRRKIRRDFHFELIDSNRGRIWPVVYSDFDLLLLYLSKYSCEYISNYNSDTDLSIMFR